MNTITRPVKRYYDSEDEALSAKREAEYAEAIDEGDFNEDIAFDAYRHFHPRYDFSGFSFQSDYMPVALPGQRLSADLRRGDVVIGRIAIGGRNYHGIINNPELLDHDNLDGGSANSGKAGYYVKIRTNTSRENEPTFLRIASSNKIVPGNVLIIRKAESSSGSMEGVGEDYSVAEDSGDNPMSLEWVNLTRAAHPNGYTRLYFVTTGGNNNVGWFPFKITNPLSKASIFTSMPDALAKLFFRVYVKARFTRGSYHKPMLWPAVKGGVEATWKTVSLAEKIEPGGVHSYFIKISSDILTTARAIDDSDLSAVLDIEVYYSRLRPDVYNYIKKASLLFYLVKPVEYVYDTALSVKPDKKKEQELVKSLRKLIIAMPTEVKSSLTVTDSKTETSAESSTISLEHSAETTVKKEGKATIEVPFAKFLTLEGSISQEKKNALVRSYSSEKTFTSEIGKIITNSIDIPPAPSKGKYRHIYLEPELVPIPIKKIFFYGQVNSYGMATKIEVLDDVPFIYKIAGWRFNISEFEK